MIKLLIINFEPIVVETERPDAPRTEGTGDKLNMSKLFS